jgi:SAM-dependent methyltransferase
MDFSPNALKAAQLNYHSATVTGGFLAGDGFALPVQDQSLDVVLSTGLLEHFHDPTPIVREMVRVLKPGGLFYSDIVPNKFSLFRSLDWLGSLKRSVIGSRQSQEGYYERAYLRADPYPPPGRWADGHHGISSRCGAAVCAPALSIGASERHSSIVGGKNTTSVARVGSNVGRRMARILLFCLGYKTIVRSSG